MLESGTRVGLEVDPTVGDWVGASVVGTVKADHAGVAFQPPTVHTTHRGTQVDYSPFSVRYAGCMASGGSVCIIESLSSMVDMCTLRDACTDEKPHVTSHARQAGVALHLLCE